MPEVKLDAVDAAELAEMLQFLSEWLTRDPSRLTASREEFAGHPAYRITQLRQGARVAIRRSHPDDRVRAGQAGDRGRPVVPFEQREPRVRLRKATKLAIEPCGPAIAWEQQAACSTAGEVNAQGRRRPERLIE